MSRQTRSNIILGLLLILGGVWFLAQQFYPELAVWRYLDFSWPWYVIGAGAAILLIGLVLGAPGMAVPAAVVAGIGGLLYWQNETGNWESWSYAWTLIPGFVGLGIILAELLGGDLRKGLREGVPLALISVLLFAVFGSFFGGLGVLGNYWPVLLILAGAWFILQPLVRRRSA